MEDAVRVEDACSLGHLPPAYQDIWVAFQVRGVVDGAELLQIKRFGGEGLADAHAYTFRTWHETSLGMGFGRDQITSPIFPRPSRAPGGSPSVRGLPVEESKA